MNEKQCPQSGIHFPKINYGCGLCNNRALLEHELLYGEIAALKAENRRLKYQLEETVMDRRDWFKPRKSEGGGE